MSNSFKKHLISKSGRWMKSSWYKRYRRVCNSLLKRDCDDINFPHPNEVVNCNDITEDTNICNGDITNCWCNTEGNVTCKNKRK